MPLPNLQRLLTAVVATCVRLPAAVTAAVGALVVAAALFVANNASVHTDLDDLISQDAPYRQHAAALEAAFPHSGNRLVVMIEGGSVDARRAAATDFADALRQRPDLVREVFAPAIDPFFLRHGLLYRDTAAMEAALDRLAAAQPILGRLGADPTPSNLVELMADGIERGMPEIVDLVGPALAAAGAGTPRPIAWLDQFGATGDADRIVVDVAPALDFTRVQPAAATLAHARAVASTLEARHAGVTFALTGSVAMEAEELDAASTGATRASLLSLALVALVLGWGLRSLRHVLGLVVTLVAGLVLTAAAGLLLVGTFTMISIAFAVLFIGLGVDFGIHVMLRAEEAASERLPWHQCIVAGTVGAAPALAVCTLTTVVAFLSFAPTAYVGLAELGIIAAAGLVVALTLSLTLLPALLALMGRPHQLAPLNGKSPARSLRGGLAILCLLAAAAGIPAAFDLRFDGDPLALRPADAPSVEAFRRLLDEAGASAYGASVLADTPADAVVLGDRLEALPEVRRVVTLESFVPEDQETKLFLLDDALLALTLPRADVASSGDADRLLAALNRARDAATRAGESVTADAARALSARLDTDPALAERLAKVWFAYWPQTVRTLSTLLEAGPVEADGLPADLRQRFLSPEGQLRLQVEPAQSLSDPTALAGFARAVVSVAPNAAGSAVQIHGGAVEVVNAMRQALLVAFVGVLGVLALTLRRTLDVALVAGAVAVAALLTVAAMAMFDLAFNFANVIVLPLLIGFGVDAAIHVVVRWRNGRHHDELARSYTPRAVLLSALTTIASFGTLMTSAHLGTASMGLLLTVALAASLLATLVVLPACLAWLSRRHAR